MSVCSLRLPRVLFVLIAMVSVVALTAARQGNAFAPAQAPDRLTALQREAEALAREEKTLLNELRQIEIDRDVKGEELARVEREIADVDRQRGEAAERTRALEGQVQSDRPALAARLVELYKLGRPGYLRLLLDADGIRSAARAYRTVSAMAEMDRQRVAAFTRRLDELRSTERALSERTARLQLLQGEARTARQIADRAVARHNALIADIDARRDLTARLAGEMQQAQQKLSALAPAVDAALLVELGRGNLQWPVPTGRLTSRFGLQRDARLGSATTRSGVDIAAEPGQPVLATEAGTVSYAEPFTGFGNLVILDHGQHNYSLYGYLGSVGVTRGVRVTRGQALGSVGRTPAGKAGLYFELRIDGRAVDPVQWLEKR